MAPPPLLSSPPRGLVGAVNSTDWSPHVIHRGQATGSTSFALTGLAEMHAALPVGPPTSRCLERSPESTIQQLIPNLGEAVQTNSLSWIQDPGRCGPHLSRQLAQSRHSLLQQNGESVTERSARRAPIKIGSRVSNLHHLRSVKSCFVGPACSEDWVHTAIAVQPRNNEAGSAGQIRLAGAVGPSFSEELRRFLAFNNNVSRLEERIQSLEKENVELFLEIWRSKLWFVRVKRELQRELFRLKMKRIFAEFDYDLCDKFSDSREEEFVFKVTKEWMVQKSKELKFIVVPLWGRISRILDVLGSIGLVTASFKYFKFFL